MTKKEAEDYNKVNVSTGISPKGYGYTYFAKREFKKDEKIMLGFGRIVDHQTSHSSVQIGPEKHFVPQKWTSKYWNHSCNPNSYVKTEKHGFPALFALRKIKKGEEITYPYWMTEFKWSKNAKENKVSCLCGDKKCRGKILSFSQLPKKEQALLRKKGMVSNYLHKNE